MFGKKIDFKKLNEVILLSSKILRVLYFLLVVALVYVFIGILRETRLLYICKTVIKVVSPLFIGLIIAYLFEPLVKWLEGRGIKRVWGALLTYVLLFLILFLILSSLIPLLIDQGQELLKMIPRTFNTVKSFSQDVFKYVGKTGFDVSKIKNEFFLYINDFASSVTTTMPENFLGFMSNFISYLGTFILGLIIGFFLIVTFDGNFKFFNLIPDKHRKVTLEVIDKVDMSLRSYVKGAALDCMLIFALSSIGLWICGLKAPVLFGLFCGITNIIPYAGPYIGGFPAVVVGFTQDPLIGIFSLVVIFVIQFLEGNFLQPLIMSKTTKLHPVTIILGLLLFGHFFGIIGMLISTPVFAVLKTIFNYYDEKYGIINRKKISHDE